MTIYSLILIILSNSVSSRNDLAILFSRSVFITYFLPSYLIVNSFNDLYNACDSGIGIYGGLFFVSPISHTFHSIIYIITSVILILTGFYPSISPNNILENIKNDLKNKFNNNKNTIDNLGVNSNLPHIQVEKDKGEDVSKIKNTLTDEKDVEEPELLSYKAQMFKILEYPLIISFIVTGAIFLISTSDLISIFISIELQSYGLYLLSTIYRESEFSTSGGLMYFLLGGLSSCFILLGTALLYANSGTTSLDNLHVINDISNICMFPIQNINSINDNILDIVTKWGKTNSYSIDTIMDEHKSFMNYNSHYIIISLIFITVGFLFKVSAAPFHFWSPNVYDSIPTMVTTFVAIIAKISIFIFLSGQIVNNFVGNNQDLDTISSYINEKSHKEYNNIENNYNPLVGSNLLISSLLSLIIGTVLGLTQSRIKRLFAYSTISHLGFILLGIAINSVESIQAFLFYIIQYSFTNLNAFLLLICIGYSYHYYENKNIENLVDKINSPIQLINQLKGYFYINPLLSLSLCITLFSFTGIPPLIGFFGKMMILSAAIDKGYIFMCLLAILTSVISAGYYLYIIKQIFFYKTDYTINSNIKKPNYELGKFIPDTDDNTTRNTADKKEKEFRDEYKKNNTFTHDLVLSNYLSSSVSILTLLILFFTAFPAEGLNLTCLLSLILI